MKKFLYDVFVLPVLIIGWLLAIPLFGMALGLFVASPMIISMLLFDSGWGAIGMIPMFGILIYIDDKHNDWEWVTNLKEKLGMGE